MLELTNVRSCIADAIKLVLNGQKDAPVAMLDECGPYLDRIGQELAEAQEHIRVLEQASAADKRSLPVLGGLMLGYGVGRASQMPDECVIGVGLITAAESLLRLVAPEEMAPEVEGPRQRWAVQGIVNAWEERRALACRVWTTDDLVARGFNPEHLGDAKYRLDNGGLKIWLNDWDEGKDDWLEFDPTAGYEDGPRMTLEALEAWLLSNL